MNVSVTVTGAKEAAAFFRRLVKNLPKKTGDALSSGTALSAMFDIGVNGMAAEVYGVPESPNYKRKDNLFNAVKVRALGDGGSQVMVDAGATPSRKYPATSYGYFLTVQWSAKSQHQYLLPRPYLEFWLEAADTFALAAVDKAVLGELRRA